MILIVIKSCSNEIEQHSGAPIIIIIIIKATPTIVGEAFIFYLWSFFCHAPILPRDDAAALRQKYISG